MSRTSLADRLAKRMSPDLDRRGFLSRTAMVGTAMAVTPASFILQPGDAYSQVCATPSSCPAGARCRGYTEMCCTLYGSNSCPAGTTMAGWWRADGSGFCGTGAPRFYMDCNANCGGCGCGSSGVCGGSCAGVGCTCAGCNCNNWKQGCSHFRYGNCNNHVRCVGPILCRVVSCTPPWQLDPGCTTNVRYDNNTRFHDRPCLHAPALPPPSSTDGDLWMVTVDGSIFTQNDAPYMGGANSVPLQRPIVGMAATPTKQGYWLVASDGGIFAYGDAVFYGSTGSLTLNQPVVGMAATHDGGGYWLVARDGGVFCFGNAQFVGSGVGTGVPAPFVGMVGRSTDGYWLAAADGRVRTFGSAPAVGNGEPHILMSASITSISGTSTGGGFYLVAGDGGIYPYGDAGSTHGTALISEQTMVGSASHR